MTTPSTAPRSAGGPAPSPAPTTSRGSAHLRIQEWARRRHATHLALRAVVLLLGSTLLLAGLAMLILPGPGWVVILLGLVVLGSEFHWARRLLERARAGVQRAATRIPQRPRTRAVLTVVLVLTGIAVSVGVATAVSAYV